MVSWNFYSTASTGHVCWYNCYDDAVIDERLTLEAVGVEKIFTFLVWFDSTLGAPETLPGKTPQQTLTLEAVGRWRGRPDDEVVWSCTWDGVDESLERLAIDVLLLYSQYIIH